MSKKKWYVVFEGREPGVYDTWDECKQMVWSYPNAKYKSFESQSEAFRAYEDGYEAYVRKHYGAENQIAAPLHKSVAIMPSICVDAACSGNPGPVEYRGVHTDSHQQIFRVGPYEGGSNNIGEFLALVHGLALLHQQQSNIPIYSDSVTAISWVRKKKCKTLIPRNEQSEKLFQLIERAEQWLQTHTYTNPILKWDTPNWGEIPADFGRK